MEKNEFDLKELFEKLNKSSLGLEVNEVQEFIKLNDEVESLTFNTLIYIHLSSFRQICEHIYTIERSIEERNRMQDFMNCIFNQLIPKVIKYYKEQKRERKNQH